MQEFRGFPKLSRLSRPVVVTEKIDGTNAQIFIADDGATIQAGSRNRWVTVGNDNYGFAQWVETNKEELLKLGPGHHFGEWWGHGIQRNYAQTKKRFSLFNTAKWGVERPACCDVVPVLAELPTLDIYAIRKVLAGLLEKGSVAAPGFMQPEGIVIYHTHGNHLFKMTEDDEAKGAVVSG